MSLPWGRIALSGNTTVQSGIGSAEVQLSLPGGVNLACSFEGSVTSDAVNNRFKLACPGDYLVELDADISVGPSAGQQYQQGVNLILAARKNQTDVPNFLRNFTLQPYGFTPIYFKGIVQTSDLTDRVNAPADPLFAYLDFGIKVGLNDAQTETPAATVDITLGRLGIHVFRLNA